MIEQLLTLAQDVEIEGGALFAGGLGIAWILGSLVGVVLWIWALIKAIQDPGLDGTMRIVWVLVIVFTGCIGAAIYLIIGGKSGPAPGSS